MQSNTPAEGDVFDILQVGGHRFTIRYGYYEEEERGITDPIPVYPCFIKKPHYTAEGQPLITRFQDACEHYAPSGDGDGWCADCIYCANADQEIGICQCKQRKKMLSAKGQTR